MRPVFVAVAIVAAVHAAAAVADKYFAVTPSGAAEMVFPDKPESVIGKLSAKCIDAHWTITSTIPDELVCEDPLNMGQSILGQMLLGNSYSTPPHRYFRFNVAEVNGVSRVQASGWIELQMAFGQTKRSDFSGAQFQNNIMAFMESAGGKYPFGTTFPNNAVLGVQTEGVQLGKYAGFRVTQVDSGSAAEKAGMKVGDIVNSIAGRQFKSLNDYLNATAKAAETPTYSVQFMRDGKSMTAIVQRAFRPTFSEKVVAKEEPVQAAPADPHQSVADELQKLLTLKNEGVLTEEEFEAQKKKLLGEQ